MGSDNVINDKVTGPIDIIKDIKGIPPPTENQNGADALPGNDNKGKADHPLGVDSKEGPILENSNDAEPIVFHEGKELPAIIAIIAILYEGKLLIELELKVTITEGLNKVDNAPALTQAIADPIAEVVDCTIFPIEYNEMLAAMNPEKPEGMAYPEDELLNAELLENNSPGIKGKLLLKEGFKDDTVDEDDSIANENHKGLNGN